MNIVEENNDGAINFCDLKDNTLYKVISTDCIWSTFIVKKVSKPSIYGTSRLIILNSPNYEIMRECNVDKVKFKLFTGKLTLSN